MSTQYLENGSLAENGSCLWGYWYHLSFTCSEFFSLSVTMEGEDLAQCIGGLSDCE
ncbi:hypothetical protein Tco_1248143, partial [Tanacetum coccineum]